MPKNYQTVIFDLDGTLVEPREGIINSVVYALEKMGVEVKDKNELEFFIGPPLEDSFSKYFKNLKDIAQAKLHYIDYFDKNWKKSYEVYPGVVDLLKDLKAAKKDLAIATTKYKTDALKILTHFKLDKYFKVIEGSTPGKQDTAKKLLIKRVLDQLKIDDKMKKNVIMVGDTPYDIIGAHQNGIDSIGVIWGKTDPFFKKIVPTCKVRSVEELKETLI
jgi:phosphoglycolate phosphatase